LIINYFNCCSVFVQ